MAMAIAKIIKIIECFFNFAKGGDDGFIPLYAMKNRGRNLS